MSLNPLLREFPLKSLSGILGKDNEEHLLCPVRALWIFCERTKDLHPGIRNLFVSTKDGSKSLSNNTLSFILREVILQSHQQLAGDHFPLLRVRTHEIRGIATSLNMWRNKSLYAVLEAASYRCPQCLLITT